MCQERNQDVLTNKLTGSSETQIHQLVPERFAAAETLLLINQTTLGNWGGFPQFIHIV